MSEKEAKDMSQKELYTELWKTEYIPSACAIPMATYVAKTSTPKEILLEIGCGDGTTVQLLRAAGFEASGVDITMAGIDRRLAGDKRPHYYFEDSAVKLGFVSDVFDFTFSTDCLEHLPHQDVDHAICEILRVTKPGGRTFHVMPIWGDDRLGLDVHPSKHPPEWWEARFALFNTKGIEVKIREREAFLQEMKP